MKIAIINGPNLNLLGKRETDIYGNKTFDSYLLSLKKQFPQYEIAFFQSNIEGELIDKIQEYGLEKRIILLNAGGYTHTSVSITDAIHAISALGSAVIEIHISQIAAREEFRHTSLIGSACIGSICGFGLDSYRLGLLAAENLHR
ncbi:MAG: type II 3-dehydroquinate dehydratase [Bacteroidales bacterium]